MHGVRSNVKHIARRAVDRVVLPYVELVVSRSSCAPRPADEDTDPTGSTSRAQPVGATSDYFHMASHELRTIELERVPKGARRALSVGAQGRWYFDWFEQAVGPLEEHIGIEAFEPKPDDLPDYVTWIPDTADHMAGVASGSVDLVFAGQTSEHLWAHELAGFLLEARRVLADDGILALDSPNRVVTTDLHWSHGGHTIELSATEMSALLAFAGFDVLTTRGIWRCVSDGRVLELEEGLDDPVVFTRRAASGGEHPDECFIWWINARKADRAPDEVALRAEVDRLFAEHWETRVSRGLFPAPGARALPLVPGAAGVVGATLPFPLHGGRWTIGVELAEGRWSDIAGLELRIVAPGDHLIHHLVPADGTTEGATTTWVVDQPWLLFALSIEVHVASVRSPAAIALPLTVRALPE